MTDTPTTAAGAGLYERLGNVGAGMPWVEAGIGQVETEARAQGKKDERERSNKLFRGLRRTVTHGGLFLTPATLGTLVGIIDAILDEVSA